MLSFSRTPCTSDPKGYALSRRNFLIATIETDIVLGYGRSALAAAEFPLAAGLAVFHQRHRRAPKPYYFGASRSSRKRSRSSVIRQVAT